MKKFFTLLVTLIFFAPTLTVVNGQATVQTEEELFATFEEYRGNAEASDLAITDLMMEIEVANQELISVFQNADFYVTFADATMEEVSEFRADMSLFYDENQSIRQGHVIFETINASGTVYQEAFFSPEERGKGLYVRNSTDVPFDNMTEGQGISEEYTANPEYFGLLDIILGLEQDLILEETDQAYLLMPAHDDIDLFNLFQAQFDLSVTGVDPNEMDKEALFVFNKDNLYLEYILLDFSYEPEGQAMRLNTQTTFQDWNELDENMVTDLLDANQ